MPAAIGSSDRTSGLIFKLTPGTLTACPSLRLPTLPGRPCPIAAAHGGRRRAVGAARRPRDRHGQPRFGDIVTGTGAPRDRIAARLKTSRGRGRRRQEAVSGPPAARRVHADRVGSRAAFPSWTRCWPGARPRRRRPTTRCARAATAPSTDTGRHRDRRTHRHRDRRQGLGRAPLEGGHLARPRADDGQGPVHAGHRLPARHDRRHAAAAADLGADGVHDGRRRTRPRGVHLPARRIRLQPDRAGPRRTGLHAAGLGRRLRTAQHAAHRARATRRSRSR